MNLTDLRGSIFTAVTFSNLISAKIIGISWLTWSDTFVILFLYLIVAAVLRKVLSDFLSEDEVESKTDSDNK